MIYIAGSNLFKQWFADGLIFNSFRPIDQSVNDFGLQLHKAKVLQINWSYNILEIDNELYLCGACHSKEKQCVKLRLPPEHASDVSNLKVAGNDYKIVLASEYSKSLWVQDLCNLNELKKINVNIEEPLCIATKRCRTEYGIKKVVIVNDSYLYLTMECKVYSGLLPSYVDTSHCIGKVQNIQCGYEHFLLLTDVGRVYTWGNGRRMQLGHGDISNLETPTEIEALAGIKITKISAGGWHSLALSESGDLYAWGWNDSGQLGITENNLKTDTLQSHSLPTLIDLFEDNGQELNINIKDIGCGSKHSAILLEDNSVWTSGCNKYGQLGFSEEKYQSLNSFRRAYEKLCDGCMIMCGPWTSVIIENK